MDINALEQFVQTIVREVEIIRRDVNTLQTRIEKLEESRK
jgi:ubiquinone biosynthesis protein UbiJ